MLQEIFDFVVSDDYYEDGMISVQGAAWSNDYTALELQIAARADDVETRRWKLTCGGVRDERLILRWGSNFEIIDDHVLLWPHIKSNCKLWFHGAPANVAQVIGSLWQTHRSLVGDWFEFSRFLNPLCDLTDLLAGGHGLFAEGPEPLLAAYQDVLQNHGCAASITFSSHRAQGSDSPDVKKMRAVCIAHSYVVAETVTAIRVD